MPKAKKKPDSRTLAAMRVCDDRLVDEVAADLAIVANPQAVRLIRAMGDGVYVAEDPADIVLLRTLEAGGIVQPDNGWTLTAPRGRRLWFAIRVMLGR